MKKILARLSRWICQIKTKASKAAVHFKEWICKAGNKVKKLLEDDVLIARIIVICVLIGMIVAILVGNASKSQEILDLKQSLTTAEQGLYIAEQNLHNMEQELQTANEENVELSKMVEELQKYKDEIEQQRFMEKLEELRNDPWTPTLDFLPYLPGDFEENVMLMAIVIFKEAGNGSDEEQQLQGLVLLGRVFDPHAYPNEIGDLKKVIFAKNQYPWAAKGIDNIVPTEQCIKNARAVLTGNVLDTPNINGMTRNVKFANTTHLGDKPYCQVWNENQDVWVYFDYGS